MLIQVFQSDQTQIEQDVNLNLPAYFHTNGLIFFAIVSKSKMLSASTIEGSEGVRCGTAYLSVDWVECTEEEFIEARTKAVLAETDLFYEACPSVTPPHVTYSDLPETKQLVDLLPQS